MTARWTSRVATRLPATPVGSSDENAVEDRILQLAADIGGDPAVDLDTAAAALIDAINEVRTLALGVAWPRTYGAPAFHAVDGAEEQYREGNTRVGSTKAAVSDLTVQADVQLQDGAILNSMEVYATITGTSPSVTVYLFRYDRTDWSSQTEIASLTLNSGSGIVSGSVGSLGHTVDNSAYAYRLEVVLHNETTTQQSQLISVNLAG